MLAHDRSLIKKSGLFDPVYYLLNYPDVRIADMDPLTHFIKVGWKEGRNPSEKFNTKFYLDSNPDVKQTEKNPLVHYIRYGKKEGRRILPTTRFVQSGSVGAGVPAQSLRNLLSTYNFRKSLRFIKAYGLGTFLKKAKNKLIPQQNTDSLIVNRPVRIESIDPKEVLLRLNDEVLETVPKKVSVVIPVKNAGAEFSLLMKNYRQQKGFEGIEIVVVDSGSTDKTKEIAKEYGAVVVEIRPEEFTHSYARNLGAETATGDYIFFTVQDALPPSQSFLHELYKTLVDNGVSAVSCAETSREDADLFFKQICWNHYNFLGVNEGDRITSLPKKDDHVSLRQNGQLTDIANFIPKEIFEKYKFRLNYAEDLDLGVRLIKDGHKLAFLGSTRIIHSHNRPSWYFLKRGYVDNQFLNDVFPDYAIPRIVLTEFAPDLAFTYAFLGRFIEKLNAFTTDATPEDFEIVLGALLDGLYSYKLPEKAPVLKENYLDVKTQNFISELIEREGLHKTGTSYDGILIHAYAGYLNITSGYLRNTYEVIDKKLLLDIKNCLCKSFAIVVGAHLAYCYQNRNGRETTDMDFLHKTLMEGV